MKYIFAFLLIILTLSQTAAQSLAAHSDAGDIGSGWIPIRVISGRILFRVTINGHTATARLVNSVPTVAERDFIDKYKIAVTTQAPGQPPQAVLTLQIGALVIAQPINAQVSRHQGQGPQTDMMLGDEVFNHFIVDVDFPNRRVAFRRPDGFVAQQQAKALAFKQDGDSRAVPVSIEHGPAMLYSVYMGDPAPVSVYQNYYAAYNLLQGRARSVRMGGGPKTPPEAVATLGVLNLAGSEFKRVPAVFPDDSVTGPHPADIAGHIGLAILSRCHIIFDYGHNRLYFIPGATAAPFAKDRSGLVMKQAGADYIVRFVCPGSPAMKAGFALVIR